MSNKEWKKNNFCNDCGIKIVNHYAKRCKPCENIRKSKAYKGKKLSEEHKKKIGLSSKIMWKNPTWNEEKRRGKIRKSRTGSEEKKIWRCKKCGKETSGYRYERCQGCFLKDIRKLPNNFEKDFIISNIFPQIEYTGNGNVWIKWSNNRYKNPDFLVKDQNKLIELFGEYWHKPEEERTYIEEYGKIGYDCLVIWYKDWTNNKKRELDKVSKFLGE